MHPSTPDAAALLAWYDRHRRDLPWRARPGESADPYAVWLSEVMLQQTTVAAVGPRFTRFLARFPTVQALAFAPWAAVAREWAGLGYYARARNLHAAAKAVVARGGFPEDEAGLAELPGVGTYTAAAVAAIAFGRPAVPVDGNVERVMARVFAVEAPLPGAKRRLAALAREVGAQAAARARPGDFAQALFDLGAILCAPRRPTCAPCPWRGMCAGAAAGLAESLPRKVPKPERPQRYGVAFWLEDAAGRVLLRRRPARGLLGGMLVLPSTPWRDEAWGEAEAAGHAPAPAAWVRAGRVRHVFTHFALDLAVWAGQVTALPAGGETVARGDELTAGLPGVMAKAARAGLKVSADATSVAG